MTQQITSTTSKTTSNGVNNQETQPERHIPKKFLALAAILFVVFALGLLWLAGAREQAAAGGTFGFMAILAFAAGLSMIVLPCTLPLVFVIVPLAAGKDYKRGFFMALLFGLGLAATITVYGVAMAYFGKIFGIAAATPWLLLIAGLAAYLFGFSELHIFRIPLPTFGGSLPQSLQQKGDYVKSLGLGLLLGNAGIGCPNPLFYVLLLYIAGTANIGSGALLGFIHGVGRALPIILLTILAMFGIQATKTLSDKRIAIEKLTAWLLILIGAFLIPTGVFNLRGWWITAIPIDMRAVILAAGLLFLPLVAKFFVKKPQKILFIVVLAISALATHLIFANGGDQRLIEQGKYYINLSRAPFTPRVGVKTSFVASFFDVGANRLISEDLIVRLRISKLGDAPKGNFIFEQDNVVVKGGVLEFPYTFSEAALHEIFFDFAFASNPEKVYNAPDFLIDVPRLEAEEKSNNLLILGFSLGIIVVFLVGLLIGRRIKSIS